MFTGNNIFSCKQVNLTRLAEEIYVVDPNDDESRPLTFDSASLENGITYNISMTAINHLGLPGKGSSINEVPKFWTYSPLFVPLSITKAFVLMSQNP
jgi:hypothetical protein